MKNLDTKNLKNIILLAIGMATFACSKKQDNPQPVNSPTAPVENTSNTLCNGNGSNSYFPLKLGNKWTYDIGKQNVVYQTITKEQNKSGDIFFSSNARQYSLNFEAFYILKPNGDIYKSSIYATTLFVPAKPAGASVSLVLH